jgi:hypothetical protein
MIICDYCGVKYDPAVDPPLMRITASGSGASSAPIIDWQMHPECADAVQRKIAKTAGKNSRPDPLPPVKQPTAINGNPVLPTGGAPLV